MGVFQLTPDAKASVMQIARYTQKTWGIRQRNSYLKLIDDCFQVLAEAPMQGKARPEIHHILRSYPVGKHIVFYIIKQDYIVIVNVLHERMDTMRYLQSQHG